jgi:hypothetical protein
MDIDILKIFWAMDIDILKIFGKPSILQQENAFLQVRSPSQGLVSSIEV